MKKIRLLLIEDNRLLRDGILSILKPHKDIVIITSTGDSKNPLLKIHPLKPDVVLLDLGLRSQNSLRVVEIVKREFPRAKVIVMDLAPVQADILQYVEAGASGFILKDASLIDFLSTIRTVSKGATVLRPLLVDSLFSQIVDYAMGNGRAKLLEAVRMTKREREVITLLGNGLSNKEIAQKIHPNRAKGCPYQGQIASICGTDVHIYDWTRWAQHRFTPPRIIGHEFVGNVTKVGEEVAQVKVGDRVSAESHLTCGHCYQCKNGFSEVCRNFKLLGADHDGTFGEYLALPEHVVWKNDEEIPDEWATIQEPFGNPVDTVLSEEVSGKTVLMLGAGPIGLFATGIAKACGASLIIVSDPNNYRLDISKKMGAHIAVNPRRQDVVPLVMEATQNNGVDVVLEFSGNNQALNQGLKAITPGGRISILGMYERRVTIDLNKDVLFKKIPRGHKAI